MKPLGPILLTGALLLSACSSPLGGLGSEEASLTVMPQIADGRYATQATFEPYTRSSIDHVVFRLYTVASASVVASASLESTVSVGVSPSNVEKTLTGSAIDSTVTFKGLHFDTTYRIRAFAYEADNTLISDFATSYLDVYTRHETVHQIPRVPVKLVDRLFQATATSSLDVTNGTIRTEDEAIDFELGE
jgi:hypothetical protein